MVCVDEEWTIQGNTLFQSQKKLKISEKVSSFWLGDSALVYVCKGMKQAWQAEEVYLSEGEHKDFALACSSTSVEVQ